MSQLRLRGVIVPCLLACGSALFAGTENKPTTKGKVRAAGHAKAKLRARGAGTPARLNGVGKPPGPPPTYGGGETISAHRNALGQTVYSVSPSHFDISPPLRDMALTVYSAALAQNMDPAEVKKDFVSGLLPNIQVVPSGVWALGRAQEKKCAYIFVG